jgi:hypothetical protein
MMLRRRQLFVSFDLLSVRWHVSVQLCMKQALGKRRRLNEEALHSLHSHQTVCDIARVVVLIDTDWMLFIRHVVTWPAIVLLFV